MREAPFPCVCHAARALGGGVHWPNVSYHTPGVFAFGLGGESFAIGVVGSMMLGITPPHRAMRIDQGLIRKSTRCIRLPQIEQSIRQLISPVLKLSVPFASLLTLVIGTHATTMAVCRHWLQDTARGNIVSISSPA